MAAAEFFQAGHQAGREGQLDAAAAPGSHRRPGPVAGQLKDGDPGQGLAPVRELLLENPAGQPLPLPHREVPVLHRQRRQHRRRPGQPALVELRQLAEEDPPGPAVGRHVVEGHHRDAVLRVKYPHPGPHQRRGRQVKPLPGELAGLGAGSREPLRLRAPGRHLAPPQRDARPGGHPLHRAPVHFLQRRPQHLMPRHHVIQRPLPGSPIQAAPHPPGEPQQVPVPPLRHRIQEPQPLLRERHRQHPAPINRRNPGRARPCRPGQTTRDDLPAQRVGGCEPAVLGAHLPSSSASSRARRSCSDRCDSWASASSSTTAASCAGVG